MEQAIRPRFKVQTPLSKKTIIHRIQSALAKETGDINGTIIDQHVILRIPIDKQHYWSPQLDLEIEYSTNGSVIKGIFGPRPSVWFMYVFFYSVLGFISIMVMIMGFSQLNLGLSARILWLLPIVGILFGLAFYTAKAGQKLGADEMKQLYHFVQQCLE